MPDPNDSRLYVPSPLEPEGFNPHAVLPYGCQVTHLQAALNDFLAFLRYVNQQLLAGNIARFESLLMPANFSSIVGEFVIGSIPRYCPTLVKNRYHNGHPDPIPAQRYPDDKAQHTGEGIEVKASRYHRGWQGHNPENVWMLVVVFEVESAVRVPGAARETKWPVPFRFLMVVGAQLETADWKFSGRAEGSRRTITASITESGYRKMMANWIYRAASVRE